MGSPAMARAAVTRQDGDAAAGRVKHPRGRLSVGLQSSSRALSSSFNTAR